MRSTSMRPRPQSAAMMLIGLALGANLRPRCASAATLLPYTQRTHQYSAWGTTVQGDLETLGMAGAEVGLADSRVGSVDNPAGVPLTLDSSGFQLTGNNVQDGYLQSYAAVNSMTSTVITYCPYPWGASFATWSPTREGDTYQVGSMGESLEVKTREYHFSFANVFLSDRLSLGVSLILGENDQTFSPVGGGTLSHTAWGFGVGLGALYVLPYRILLGVSYTPPIHYGMIAQGDVNPAVGGFFQDAASPYRLGVGVGWLPNRFFKASAGLYVFGATDNTALLGDDSRSIGVNTTIQPRFGASYQLIDCKSLAVSLSAGTYLEVLREQDDFSRLHGTIGLTINPWIFSFGWGLDEARFYQNFIVSAGLDLGRLLRKFELIPDRPDYPMGGVLPNPARLSDQGLPHALDKSWVQRDDGAISVGLRMPRKIQEDVLGAPEGVKNFGYDLIETITDLPSDIGGEGLKLWRRSLGTEVALPPGPPVLPTPEPCPESRWSTSPDK